MIPYEELLMEPNRTPAERLGAIVGRRFVFSREQWPAWQRLVDRYTWAVVIKAADACDPTKRFSNQVEAMCIQLKSQAADSPPPSPAVKRADPKESGASFAAIRARILGTPTPQKNEP